MNFSYENPEHLNFMNFVKNGAVNFRFAFRNIRDQPIYRTGTLRHWDRELTSYVRSQLQIETYLDFNGPGDRPEAVVRNCQESAMCHESFPLVDYAQPYRQNLVPTPANYSSSYLDLLLKYSDVLLTILSRILLHRAGLLFGCLLGKDRTGLVAILCETYLGVPREKAIEHYLLSNNYLAQSSPLLSDLANKRGVTIPMYLQRIEAKEQSIVGFLKEGEVLIAQLFAKLDILVKQLEGE